MAHAAGCFAVGFGLLVSCGGGTTIADVEQYDQSCELSTDCVLVIDGDICCGCPNAAINESELERYQSDLGECSAQCDIGCVDNGAAVCVDGACMLQSQVPVCEPGSEVFCSCGGGQDGVQTCLEDGSDFGDCVCG